MKTMAIVILLSMIWMELFSMNAKFTKFYNCYALHRCAP